MVPDCSPGLCSRCGRAKPRLVLTLQHAGQEPAAVAVLQALYAVKPLANLSSDLPQKQKLHAALLADMWQLSEVRTAAVKLAVDAANADAGVAAAAGDYLVKLGAVPNCLLPLFLCIVNSFADDKAQDATLERLLLSVLGDLEEVWADEALRDTPLTLSPRAIFDLLSLSELKVATEDNILYTAQTYVYSIKDSQQQATAKQLLAPVVRVQHLSQFWLTAAAWSSEAGNLLLSMFQEKLKQLLMLKALSSLDSDLQTMQLQQAVPGAPNSWGLGQRALRPGPKVTVQWKLSVSQLARSVGSTALTDKQTTLVSPCCTPPVGGCAFGIRLEVKPLLQR